MRELEALTSKVERPRLVVHLPGFNEEAVKATPLYELCAAGVRFRKGAADARQRGGRGQGAARGARGVHRG